MEAGCDLLGELLPLNRKFKIILRGGSMHPFLKDGDLLEIDPAISSLRKHDIVVYKLNGILFAHRISAPILLPLEEMRSNEQNAFRTIRSSEKLYAESGMGKKRICRASTQFFMLDCYRSAGMHCAPDIYCES